MPNDRVAVVLTWLVGVAPYDNVCGKTLSPLGHKRFV